MPITNQTAKNPIVAPKLQPPAPTQAPVQAPVNPHDWLMNPAQGDLGAQYAKEMADRLSLANHGKDFSTLYNEALGTAGNIASSIGSMASDPQTRAIADPNGSKLAFLNGIANFAKGFAANVNKGAGIDLNAAKIIAETNKLNAETAALSPEATDLKRKKAVADLTDPIVTKYEANTDIKDEITRSQAIAQGEKLLNDPNMANNRQAEGAIRMTIIQALKPEFKRLAAGEAPDFGSMSGLVNMALQNGAKNVDEVGNAIVKGVGVLDDNSKLEYQNILDNLKELSKKNFANAAQPYIAMFNQIGMPELAPQYLRKPEGYDYTYTAPANEQITKVNTPKVNESVQHIQNMKNMLKSGKGIDGAPLTPEQISKIKETLYDMQTGG